MTKQQAEWAKQHDWHYQTAKKLNGDFVVYVPADVVAGDVPTDTLYDGTQLIAFSDYQELRAWAGY